MASPVFAAQEAEEEDVAPHVVVAVRLRPLSEKELLESSQKIVKANGNKLVFSDKDQEYLYNFDHVLGDAADQAAVFDCLGKPQVEKAFDGYNSTIFAYGQTGSGKTFTMLNVQGSKKDMGLIPRISEALFARLAEAQRSSTTSRFLVQCSFLEIYNEVIYDLLVPRSKDSRGKGLEIREQKGLGVYVKDLTEEVVAEVEQLDRLLHAGFSQRTTSATAMNDASSRSHCVFTICLHYQDTSDSSRNTISKLHLVDLAGSEKTGSDERKHLKENANINKSLSALGNVINALSFASSVAGGVRRNAFVPYRDSKLTRVLQESLGGNAFCTMIATISPAAVNSEETWSTLQYAKRAKTIRVAATRNKESQQREELQREVDELRKFAQEASSTEELEARHKSEIEALEAFMKQTWEDKQRLSKEHEEQRELARQEVQRANEERQAEQRRRIEALEKLGDLNVTLQSFVALGQAGHVSWPQRLASVLRLPQQLLAQQQAVRLYREGAAAEVKELLEKASEDPIASSLLLNQAAAKLKLLATTLTALEEAERDYKGQLCALSTEIAITLAELRAEAKGETESLALLQLVQRQLGEHYSSISEQLLKEVTSLGFDLVGRDRMGLQSAPGLAEVLSSLRALPEVLSGEPLPTALGLASSEFPDEGLMGSSNGELAACARLQQSRWTAGWCPATSSKEEFLEVDVQRAPHVGRICGIALQGRLPASGHWQQTLGLLQLALGADEEALAFAQPQTFLRPPVRCVHQVAWALHKKRSFKKWQPSEQVRDYENLTKEAKLDFLSRLIEEAHTVKGPVVAGLSDSEDEDVEPLRLTAQDILAGRNCAETNRLLQLLASRALGYGEAPSWTSRWRLQYLVDDDWQWHDESFEGNSSATEVRVVQLPRPLHARKLRIYPLEWRQRPALRLELFVIQDAASPGASEVFRELQAHVTLVLSALDEVKKHVEVGMRQNALAKEQQVQEQSQLQTQLQEALAKAALSEAHLLELKAEKKRLEVLSKSQGKEIDRLSRQSSNHREECEKVQAALEDLQEQLAIICDERDLARSHELEFFYVLNRKDVELVEARKALADLTQHVKEGQIADEAAELLTSELENYQKELQEAYDRCNHIEAENTELRAEKERINRKREKLSKQNNELREKLKQSEQLRQAARERVEQLVAHSRGRDSASGHEVFEDLAKSMAELTTGTAPAPKRSLQRSRTVGTIAGTGAAAAEALSSMRDVEVGDVFGPSPVSGSDATMLPVFGMTEHLTLDGSTPNTGRSGRSTISGPLTEVHHQVPPSPAFGAQEETRPSRFSRKSGRQVSS